VEFNLADLWERVVDALPDHEAMVCGARRLSYAQADARANQLAHHLASTGIGAGDHVALYLYNGTEYLEAMLAAFKLRAVPINVNYRYGPEELRYLLSDADARAIVFHREFGPTLAAVRDELPLLDAFVMVDDWSAAPVDAVDALEYERVLASTSAARDFAPRSADDLYILYTGGTTGMPKGVMWRAEDVFFAAFGGGNLGDVPITRPESVVDSLEPERRVLPACPFMHGTAHWMAFATLYSGGTVVISPEHHFDPVALWELIAREHVSFLVIVGDAFARPLIEALDRVDAPDVSALTVVLSGGAVLSSAVKTTWVERLPGTLLIDGFGASETGGQGQSVSAPGGSVETAARFQVNDETTVLDDDLHPAGAGIIGWLARRGHVPLGYYRDPDKTAATFPVVDGVRWSVPGDHARLEADGTITVLGRGSVSINTGGEKVYPEEVESALKSHPSVFDAVVVGIPDRRWGEQVTAVVQPRPGATPAADELSAHVRAQLASYKVPRAVVLVDDIVRSPSGKADYVWARRTAEARIGTP
jgi:acyl-CoA synthetase (AMP-forming)/AMP-acid ligase II